MRLRGNLTLLLAGSLIGALVYFDATAVAQSNAFSQLVEAARTEVEKKGGKLTIGITWTERQAKPVIEEFRKEFPFIQAISFVRLRTVENMQRMLMEFKSGRPPDIDIPFISNELWPEYIKEKMFLVPRFPYKDLIRSLPQGWEPPDPRSLDPQGLYMACTGSARGIAYNKNLIRADQAPKGWEDCLVPKWRGKIIYDPRATLSAFQHDAKTRDWFLKWLKGLLANKVVLNRGMGENLEKVTAGEYLISCTANYHNAMPMIDEGAPLVFVLPDPFTLDIATEMHVVRWSTTPAATQLFALWLATRAQPLIEKVSYRGFPWVPASRKFPMAKGKYMAICGADCAIKADQYSEEHAKILGLPGAR
jgi:ABC-type Fe3+ transport system substrate-binding protein